MSPPIFFLCPKSLAKKTIFFYLFFLTSNMIQSALAWHPTWLKSGVYARYEFNSSGVCFSNGTWVIRNSQAVLQWECIGIEGNIAQLNVSLMFEEENQVIRLTNIVHANTENRDITLMNGTYVGKTLLWLPPNPDRNGTITLTDDISAKIQIPEGWIATCQGRQKFFRVENSTEGISGAYDLDTGVLVNSRFYREPALLALNVSDPGYYGSSGITDTNINLGLMEQTPDNNALLFFLLPMMSFAIIFVFVLHQRGQNRRRKLIKKQKACKQIKKYCVLGA